MIHDCLGLKCLGRCYDYKLVCGPTSGMFGKARSLCLMLTFLELAS